jgi:tetratricopeptide (TPR) repeat protein
MAAAHYRDALDLMPEDAGCRRQLGKALMELGRELAGRGMPDKAIAALNQAIRLYPEDTLAQSELGKIHGALGNLRFDQEKYEEAATAFGEAIRLNGKDATVHYGLGRVLLRRDRREDAIAEFRKAIGIDSKYADAHAALARELLTAPGGRPRVDEEGLTHARKAAQLRPDPTTLSTLVDAEYRAGHWDELLAAATRSIANRDGTTRVRFLRALAHWRTGDKEQALTWFNIAVAQVKPWDRDDPEVLRLWSEVAELVGKPGPVRAGAGPHKPAAPAKSR